MNKLIIVFIWVFSPYLFFSQLLVNELSVHKGYLDEYQVENDWIEIINTGSSSVNLNNYYLSDNNDDIEKWRFPNYQISSSEKIIVFASGKTLSFYPNHWETIVFFEAFLKVILKVIETPLAFQLPPPNNLEKNIALPKNMATRVVKINNTYVFFAPDFSRPAWGERPES